MPNIEQYIKDNLDQFESAEPGTGHFKRFEDRLAAGQVMKSTRFSRPQMPKIAALIIVLISISVFVFDMATRSISERFAAGRQGTELPAEIREAVQYYDRQATVRITALDKLAANSGAADDLKAAALKEIRELDASTDELKNSLAMNPGNEQVLDAIVRNQRMKETMLNTIISRLSQSKN